MRVLNTRPAHQAAALQQKLEQARISATLAPMLEIETLSADITLQRHLPDASLVLVTSANAILSYEKTLPSLLAGCIVGAIGEGTQQALLSQGLPCHFMPQPPYNSEQLLACPELSDIDGKKIVVLTGRGGRGLLQQELPKRGATVIPIPTYQRQRVTYPISAWQDWATLGISHIIVTSVEAFLGLRDTVTEAGITWLAGRSFLVTSTRIQQTIANHYPSARILTATHNTDDAILRPLKLDMEGDSSE